jgi:hypothetical protein
LYLRWRERGRRGYGVITLTGATITEALITRCNFATIPASAKYIVATTTVGSITGCYFPEADIHLTNDVTLGGMVMSGNYDQSNTIVA